MHELAVWCIIVERLSQRSVAGMDLKDKLLLSGVRYGVKKKRNAHKFMCGEFSNVTRSLGTYCDH